MSHFVFVFFNPLDLDPSVYIPRLDLAKMVFWVALRRVFPNASPLASSCQGLLFSCKFIVEAPFGPDQLKLVEEEMRRIKGEKLPLKQVEMLRSNATEYLIYHGFKEQAIVFEGEEEGVFPFLKLGEVLDECFGPQSLSCSSEVGVLQLFSISALDEPHVYEVEGTAFGSLDESKAFMKAFKQVEKAEKKQNLIKELDAVTLLTPEGVIFRDSLFREVRLFWGSLGLQEWGYLTSFELKDWPFGEVFGYAIGSFGDLEEYFDLATPKLSIKALFDLISSWVDQKGVAVEIRLESKKKSVVRPLLEANEIRYINEWSDSSYEQITWMLIDPLGVRLRGPFIQVREGGALLVASLLGDFESWVTYNIRKI